MEDSYVLQLLKPKFKDFHLCFCGFAECKPLHSYGPAARPNYILHYVMKGKGIYQVGETKYPLKEGQAFLIEPESLTFYQADKTDPWSYLWVGFGGTEAQRFVRDLGLNSRQLTCAGSNCLYKELLFTENHSGRYSKLFGTKSKLFIYNIYEQSWNLPERFFDGISNFQRKGAARTYRSVCGGDCSFLRLS